MLLLHHFNMTYFERDPNFYALLRNYLFAELALYIGDCAQIAFFIWIMLSAKQFHFNFTVLSVYLYGIHLLDNFAIIAMRIMMFRSENDLHLTSSPIFISLMNFSIFSMLTAMCIMPILICERCFATVFLSDYEIRPRRYISMFLLLILGSFGAVSCVLVQEPFNIIYLVLFILFLNVIALGVNMYLKYYNRKQHQKFHDGNSEYSLAKRFQISENIKSLHMLNLIILYMGCMNFLVVVSVLILGLRSMSPEQQAVWTIVLNASIFVYSYSLSHIITCCCDKWKRHLTEMWRKIGCAPKNVIQVEPLRDTFGTEMAVKKASDTHFKTLQTTWKVPTPAPIDAPVYECEYII